MSLSMDHSIPFLLPPIIPIPSLVSRFPASPTPVLGPLLALLILTTILLLISYYYQILLYPSLFSPLRHLATAPQPFFLRRLLQEPNATTLTHWINTVPNNGLIRYKGLLNAERLLITSQESLRIALPSASAQNKPINGTSKNNGSQRYSVEKAPLDRAALEAFAGPGLVSVEGREHQTQRAQVAKALSYRNTKNQLPDIEAKTQEFLAKLDTLTRNDDQTTLIDLTTLAPALTLDLATLSILGADFDCLSACTTTPTNPSGRRPSTPTTTTATRLLTFYRPSFTLRAHATKLRFLLLHLLPSRLVNALPSWLVTGPAILARTRATAVEVAMPFVRSRSGASQQSSATETVRPEAAGLKREKPDVSLLAQFPTPTPSPSSSSPSTSESALATQLSTLLAASHESTATTLSCILALLSLPRHAHIQSRLRRSLLSSPSPPPQAPAPQSPPPQSSPTPAYLKALIFETLRLYPAFPTLGRRLPTPPEGIMMAGVRVPRNTYLVVAPWAMHRDKRGWGDDAGVWRPERWLRRSSATEEDGGSGGAEGGEGSQGCGENGEGREVFIGQPKGATYIPFGAGARACPGERWAREVLGRVVKGVVEGFELVKVDKEGREGGEQGGRGRGRGSLRVGGAVAGGFMLKEGEGWVGVRRLGGENEESE